MSLYNALFGVNPWAGTLLQALGVDPDGIPRFRDCYLDEQGRIVIHTRTGGGNRQYYECEQSCRDNYPEYFDGEGENPTGPWNADLRKLPGFLYDTDDDYDSTYADFIYEVPEEFKSIVETLKTMGAESNPSERWQKLLDDLSERNDTPAAKRALEVGKQIFGQINEALEKQKSEG